MADRRKQASTFHPFAAEAGLILLVIASYTSFGCGLANAQENAPCMQIRTACTQAGFKQGLAKEGYGLAADCIHPIMEGAPQRAQASRSLPQVDPQLIAACKARNPNFGQQKRGASRSSE